MPDKLLNVHAAVSERAALLIRLSDLSLKRDDALKARNKLGHLASPIAIEAVA